MRLKYEVVCGDALEVLKGMKPVDCIFADPKDNIGLGYKGDKDKLPDGEYVAWLWDCVNAFMNKAPAVWLSFNSRWLLDMAGIVKDQLKYRQVCDVTEQRAKWELKPCVQVYTFGQHRKSDFGNNHRPLWRLMKEGTPLDMDQIRVQSWRQRHGDPRAAKGGRVPGDVFDMQYDQDLTGCIGICSKGRPGYIKGQKEMAWGLTWYGIGLDDGSEWYSRNPQIVQTGNASNAARAADQIFVEMPSDPARIREIILEHCQVGLGDVFDFPRVTGNSKQRCDWHPTQLHEELVERCIKSSTKEGDTVLDPFGGTGTTLRVCKRIGRSCISIDIDPFYCQKVAEENGVNLKVAA